VPLNVWSKIRVEIGDSINGMVPVALLIDGVLRHSILTPYLDEVFPHVALTHDFGAAHDRAHAAIRNLKIWTTK